MLYTTLQQKIQSHFQVDVLISQVYHVLYDATKIQKIPSFFQNIYGIPLSVVLGTCRKEEWRNTVNHFSGAWEHSSTKEVLVMQTKHF